jgi:radical SAM protein with 4Fe4S-binding SPASM domain
MSASESAVVKPSYAWLTVNRNCNFRCEWCYAQGAYFDKGQEMTLKKAVELTDMLLAVGITHLFVTGGEPTLWSPLLKFNSHCHDIGLDNTIVTNAMHFGKDEFWERYIESPNTYVGVSLKAGNPKQLYETVKIRRFDLVTKGVRRAMDHFKSGVGIVYNSHLADNLVDICRFSVEECHAHSIKIDFCSPVFVENQPLAQCVMEPYQLVSGIIRDYPEIVKLTTELSFIMSIPFCFWPKSFIEELEAEDRIESVCHMVKREGIVVTSDGSLCMCNELFDYSIGRYGVDFTDAETLIDLLNEPVVNGYYDQMSRYPSNRCQECSWYNKCGGGCPLLWSVFDPEQYVQPVEGR